MNTTNAAVGTGGFVMLGRWANSEPLDFPIVVGVGAFAVGLSLLGEINGQLAERFGALVLTVAVLLYVWPIAYKLGLTDRRPRGIVARAQPGKGSESV